MPVGKAQAIVLEALGLKAGSFGQAEQLFSELGIVVIAKRQGRTSVPVVKIKKYPGSWNPGGDWDEGGNVATLSDEQRAALAPWLED